MSRPEPRGHGSAAGNAERPARRRTAGDGGKRKRRRKGPPAGPSFGRIVYWGAVVGLWLVIAVIGGAVWVGAHLPPIQSLEIPKRPPTIKIVDLQGHLLATRGDMGGAAVPLKDLPRYVPQAFIAIEDRRFYSHHGVDPDRHRARRGRQHPASRRVAGRLDADPAARQEPVPDAGAHAVPQGAGGRRWRSGWSANSARRRSSISISTGSISAPAPTASRRRRSAISPSRRRSSRWRRRRRLRAWCARRRGWRRAAIRTAPRSAPRSCWPP